MPTASITLTSGAIPVPIAPGSPALGNGASGPFASGMASTGVSARLNQYSFAIETLIGQQGGGGYGILSGLDVSYVSALNIAVAPGIALVDGWLELIGSGTPAGPQVLLMSSYTMADNTINYVWLTEAGGVASNMTLGSPPTGARILLAVVTCASGAVTAIDYAGRPSLIGGFVTRQTSDTGAPSDSPPAGWRGLTVTGFGTYLWNGSAHLLLPVAPQVTYTFASDADLVLTQPQYAASVLCLLDPHPYLTTTRNVIYPAVQTGVIAVFNDTAQSLVIKVGTGFTVAAGKRAMFYVDGTDTQRLAADI